MLECWPADDPGAAMSLDQLKQFLVRMQDEPALRQQVQAAATAEIGRAHV